MQLASSPRHHILHGKSLALWVSVVPVPSTMPASLDAHEPSIPPAEVLLQTRRLGTGSNRLGSREPLGPYQPQDAGYTIIRGTGRVLKGVISLLQKEKLNYMLQLLLLNDEQLSTRL